MNRNRKNVSLFSIFLLIALTTNMNIVAAQAEESIDVRNLQTCLKEENASLDVLVLMDSSRSLRNGKPGEGWTNKDGASDPKGIRGPILKSSLTLLQKLASESGNEFRVNLKNFGDNKGDLSQLKENWMPWTVIEDGNVENTLSELERKALYDDSKGTDWGSGLSSARDAFNSRFNEANGGNQVSCPVMIWITDGAPTDRPENNVGDFCQKSHPYALDWFRERNILVLGGLLKPKEEDTSMFKPIVTGSNCDFAENWTRGSVIEASDVSSLAWGFIGLIANIKNLVSLGVNNGNVDVDRGTSHMEVFIRGNATQWSIKTPNGSEYCSSSKTDGRCTYKYDSIIGITTLVITVDNPEKAEGKWTVASSFGDDNVKVFGGITIAPNPVTLKVDPQSVTITEGKEANFKASLVDSNGLPLDISSFRSVQICASLTSTGEEICKSGQAFADFALTPNTSDRSIPFTAIITSKKGVNRQYNVSAVVKVLVNQSGIFPTLVCKNGKEGDVCKLPNLKNKTEKPVMGLEVLSPTDPAGKSGQVYLVGFNITHDDVEERGDGKIDFKLTRNNGQAIEWKNKNELFSPGDELNLQVLTEIGGSSKIDGVIKYAVIADGKIIVRQLNVEFEIGEGRNWWVLVCLMLLAYILTAGLPYAYLLWDARRSAFLSPPDNEYAFLVLPVQISPEGKISSTGQDSNGSSLIADHRSLTKVELDGKVQSVVIGDATIEAIPPKWDPFKPTVTKVRIPDHHILTSFSGGELVAGVQSFTPNLVGESILYFNTAENFGPVASEVVQATNEDPFAVNPFSGGSSTQLGLRTSPVTGKLILIVPNSGNKKKAVKDLLDKSQATVEGVNFKEVVKKIRETEMEAALAAASVAIVEPGIDQEIKSTHADVVPDIWGGGGVSEENPFGGHSGGSEDIWGGSEKAGNPFSTNDEDDSNPWK